MIDNKQPTEQKPLAGRMSPEQQQQWLHTIRSSSKNEALTQQAINAAVMSGMIDPPHITSYRDSVAGFITGDPDTLRVVDMAKKLNKRDEPVLILGESGTGKELLAKILHGERLGEFVAVNVCAVTDTLFESELFGHIRGAFTGADKDRPGLIAQAKGGTLFLDEIGDMPLHLQAKILRVVQHRVYRKVGSNVPERVECRILAATHRNIKEMSITGHFRLDLYERLNVFSLRLKPLRDRVEDMSLHACPELVTYIKETEHFLSYMHSDKGKDWKKLYPLLSGNVRQLVNLQLRWEVFGAEGVMEGDIL